MQRHVEYLFRHIESKQRYNINDSTCLKTIEEINEVASKSIVELPNDVELYRAQLGCSLEQRKLGVVSEPPTDSSKYSWTPRPFDKNRMTPLAGITSSGRVSPKGIAVLYLAETESLAVQEMRPLPKELLTVAKFTPTRKTKIVSLKSDPNQNPNDDMYWWKSALSYAFSRPVVPSDNTIEYTPTQFISELFRQKKYDGIAYKSCFCDAMNYAFFDIGAFECHDPYLVCIEDYPPITEHSIRRESTDVSIQSDSELNGIPFLYKSQNIIRYTS